MSGHQHRPDMGSIGGILSDVATGLGNLVQGEIALARAEVTHGLKNATGGLVKIALAGVVGLVGLNVLTGAAVAGLVALGMGTVWASLVVGIALFAIAGMLVISARKALDPARLMPRRAMKSLRRDASALASTLNSGV